MISGRGNMRILHGFPPKIAFSAGLITAGVILYISWQHNPQCEIHCEGSVEWGYWILLGFSGFISVFLISLLLGFVIRRGKNT